MTEAIFVAGTDTEVGKTYVSCQLLQQKQQEGLNTLGLKPISAGCQTTAEGLRNEDALLLQQHATIKASYDDINPVAFIPPISPNIAANRINRMVNVAEVANHCKATLKKHPADFCLIESAGGWHSPISNETTMADLAKELGFPVLIVIGLRLGCLNHAILTWQSVKSAGLPIYGWIANQIDPDMLALEENIDTLSGFFGQEPIEVVSWQSAKAVKNQDNYLIT